MKLSLQCAIVGQTGSSFDVEIDDSEKVSKLKKAIAEDQKFGSAASKLQLFLAKVPKDKHDEVERTEEVEEEVQEKMTWLSSRSEDVKTLNKGEKTALLEALTKEDQELQAEDPLEDLLSGIDPPSVRQIHVLVVVPEAVDGSASEASKLDQLVEEFSQLKSELKKSLLGKRKVSHSSANSSLLNALHVRVRSSRAVQFKTDNSVQPFLWAYTLDEHGDKIWLAEEQQRDRYREYVQVNIGDALARNELCLCGVEKGEGGKDLLSVDVPGHNITLVGRTDLIILSDQVLENPVEVMLLPDVRLIIQAKREVKPSSLNQTVSELIALDIMVAEQVMALLTDFGKHWQFFWVADPTNSQGTIQSVIINNPSKAFAVIRTLLDQTPSDDANAAIGLPCVKAPIKRQKLSAILASNGEDSGTGIRESLEQYYDIASILGPDIEMARAVARQVTRSIPTLSYFS